MADRTNNHNAIRGRAINSSQNVRPFQCQWPEGCSKSFNRKSDLQRHYRIHTNERPYACDYKPCEKTFIQRSALTVHRRTHTGDKPHKCPYVSCGKCFSDSSSLARHRRIHTNDKPYICKNSRCRKAFCRKTTMTKHFRKEHPAESLHDEDDAEYTDIDDSDDEPSNQAIDLSREGSNHTFHSLDAFRGTPPHPRRASTYSADLWSLPGHSTPTSSTPLHLRNMHSRRGSASEMGRIDRSTSGTPQRTFTEPLPGAQGPQPDFTRLISGNLVDPSSANSGIPQNTFANNGASQYMPDPNGTAMWPMSSAMSNSPTSMTSCSSGAVEPFHGTFHPQAYNDHSMGAPRNQMSPHPTQSHATNLQAVQDLMSDETMHTQFDPSSMPPASQQPTYSGMPTPPATALAHPQPYHNVPVTKPGVASHQEISSATASPSPMSFSEGRELPYRNPELITSAPITSYPVISPQPPRNNYMFSSSVMAFKEPKDDMYLLPAQVHRNWASG